MKNKQFVITSGQLNTGLVQLTVAQMHLQTDDVVGGRLTKIDEILYPGQVIIRNRSGSPISYNTYKSPEEYAHSLNNPQYYDFIELPDGEVFQNPDALRVYEVAVLLDSQYLGVTGDVLIQCINYRKGAGN